MNKLDLFEEHGKLVKKMFGEGLDPEEEKKLEQIRYEIDKIEEEQYGPRLNILESFVEKIENISKKFVGNL